MANVSLGLANAIFSVAWSPDGSKLAAADESGDVTLLDAPSLEPVATLSLVSAKAVASVAWSPNGSKLAAGHLSGDVTVLDTPSLTQVATVQLASGYNPVWRGNLS